MPKDIVVCCDGTGNQYGSANSNVVKLYWALSDQDKQTGYYHPGVGTMGARNALSVAGKWWTKVRGLAFGYGFSENIADVYSFLMGAFNPGDRIFIFGFSRGAYTARAVCGLLKMCGLLTPGNEALIPYAVRLYKSNDPRKFDIAAGFKTTFSIPCRPYFLGLWDTVSSVGWILDPIHTKGGHLPYTAALPDIPLLRHAVSIDERRAFFRQNLIHQPVPAGQDIKQVWFAGVHSDVGGGYAEAESGLSQIALRWMLCEAQSAGLLLDSQKVIDVLGGKLPYAPPDPKGKLHKSLQGFWWHLAEIWPKSYFYPVPVPGQAAPQWKRGITLNLGRARRVPDGALIHQSVFDRMQNIPSYKPKNLPQQFVTVPENTCELNPRPLHGQPIKPLPKPPVHRRPVFVATIAFLALFVVIALAAFIAIPNSYGHAVYMMHNTLEPLKVERPKEVAWLGQNWRQDQRNRFYHIPQGNELIPYAWFLALEQPGVTKAPLFRDDSYLEGFGFIPDGVSGQNPDALPVGFTRDVDFSDPYTGQKNTALGLTCAACHTGELFYGDKAIRIDAGPSLIDLQKFNYSLTIAVTLTYYEPWRFRRFAHRVLGPNPPHADVVLLRKSVKYFLDTGSTEFKANFLLFPTPEGYGRTDALARIGNFVFGTELNNEKNYVKGDGPVNFPPIWDASWMDWVQYNGSIQQPMGRNVGEALGVRSRINLLGYPGKQFQNTIEVGNLHEIEKLIGGDALGKGVQSPPWPEDILGKIDHEKAAKGMALYKDLCVQCHQLPMLSKEAAREDRWTAGTNDLDHRFLQVTMVPLTEIGTDPKEAQNFANRRADTGPLGLGTVAAKDGLAFVSQRVIEQAYADLKLSPEEQDEWNGHRTNVLRAPLAYKARPHNGIWATPPYLHNGSVPNIYALLSPVSERPEVFYLGSKQYDPKYLGLDTDRLKGATQFDTRLPGNSNAGHEFNDGPLGNGRIGRKLSKEERMQIIEYLKTL
jgi:mono/diheme cytochrome c family protein